MLTLPPLRASNNQTFQLTRDFSQFVAAGMSLASPTVIRMTARLSPGDPDPPIYEWSSANTSGGVISFDPSTNLCVFTAPEGDMAAMSGTMAIDCRVEFSDGASEILFSGVLIWSEGVTRDSSVTPVIEDGSGYISAAAMLAKVEALAAQVNAGGGVMTLTEFASLVAGAPNALPSQPGVIWLNGGVLQLS